MTAWRERGFDDRAAGLALVAVLLVLSAVSWRRWGNPVIDPGYDLTVAADYIGDGIVPYRDVTYYYGPAGLYGLAAWFGIFGTSFATAWAYGYAITLSITAAYYALARQWLEPLTAALAATVVLAVGFSGTAFNFVLPHTNAATVGLLAVLLVLLAAARSRPGLAGLAVGLAALTRPDMLVAAVVVAVGSVAGRWRADGGRRAAADAAWMCAAAVALAAPVYAVLAAIAGPERLLSDNLFPSGFLSGGGGNFYANWAPLNLTSAVALAARALVYGTLLAGFAGTVVCARRASGARRVLALWPLAGAVAALLALDGLSRALGVFPGTRGVIETEVRQLLIGMSWLPALALAGAAWGVVRMVRGHGPPLGRSWPGDLALLLGAGALAFVAYNEFTTNVYATYYAALPVLVAAVAHRRLADARPEISIAALGAFGLIAVGLAAHAWWLFYRIQDVPVPTARGTYLAARPSGPAVRGAVRYVRAHSPPGAYLLALPAEPGLYFMTDQRPALRVLNVFPGTLATIADQRAALREVAAADPGLVVLGRRDFTNYNSGPIGVTYARVFMAGIDAAFRPAAAFGPPGLPFAVRGGPAVAYVVERRVR